MLPVEGQNTGSVSDLLISAAEFQAYVDRHRAALARTAAPAAAGARAAVTAGLSAGAGAGAAAGVLQRMGAAPLVPLVAEGNDEMRGTYCMLDAYCRFYGNTSGAHDYGPSLLSFTNGEFEGGASNKNAGEGGGGAAARAAWAAVRGQWSAAGFVARGGVYDFGQGAEAAAATEARWAAAGGGEEGGARLRA